MNWYDDYHDVVFQSTLSMRRATVVVINAFGVLDISIHALHEESDENISYMLSAYNHFNPRSP